MELTRTAYRGYMFHEPSLSCQMIGNVDENHAVFEEQGSQEEREVVGTSVVLQDLAYVQQTYETGRCLLEGQIRRWAHLAVGAN